VETWRRWVRAHPVEWVGIGGSEAIRANAALHVARVAGCRRMATRASRGSGARFDRVPRDEIARMNEMRVERVGASHFDTEALSDVMTIFAALL